MTNFFRYDRSLSVLKTPGGTLSLSRLFLPLFLESFLLNLMGTVNTYMLSFVSDEAVAAVGTANQLNSLVLTLFTFLSTGCCIVISQHLGANDRKSASDAAFFSLVVIGGLSLVCGVALSFFAQPLLKLMKLKDEFLSDATVYFSVISRFMFLPASLTAISAIFKSCGKPKISVGITLGMNLMNAALNYLVVFRPFEIPLYGVEGVAICNIISKIFGLAVILFLLFRQKLGLDLRLRTRRDARIILRVLHVGLPGGISGLSYSLSQVITTAIVVQIGVAAVSTKIYVSNIVFYVYVFGSSLGNAASVLIGWLVGAGRREQAYKLNLQVLRLAVCLNFVLSLLVFLFGKRLLGFFTDDPQIIATGCHLLAADIVLEVFRAFNHVEENALRGAGDVLFPMCVSIASCWCASVLLAYVFSICCNLRLLGCWMAFACDEALRGVLNLLRWYSKKWENKALTKQKTVS